MSVLWKRDRESSVAILVSEILNLVKAKYFFGSKIPCPMKYNFGETVTLEKCLESGKKLFSNFSI